MKETRFHSFKVGFVLWEKASGEDLVIEFPFLQGRLRTKEGNVYKANYEFPFLQGRLRTREHRFYSIIDFSGCQGVFSGFFNKISLMRCSKAFPMIRLPK